MICVVRQCLFAVVLAVLLLFVRCQQPATVSLHGDNGQLVWKNAGGDAVMSLKRNGSVVVLDSPLHTQEVHTEDVYAEDVHAEEVHLGNASLLATLEMVANLTEQVDALAAANANLSAEVNALRSALMEAEEEIEQTALATTWNLNDNWFDLATTVNESLTGFWGGFAAGDFAYYVPYRDASHHGRVVRINMFDFSSSGVEWFDLATTVNAGLKGFRGGFFAGEFAYYVPHFNGTYHGQVVRINMSDFASSGVDWFDLATVHAGLKGFRGGFAAGEFAYYVPEREDAYHGRVVRINTSDFSSSGVEWFDLATVNAGLKGFRGGFAAGEFAYYVPFYNGSAYLGQVVRINMSDFSSSGAEWFDLATTVDASLKGFSHGFVADEFAYYVPYYDGLYHGRVVRINMSDFSSSGVEWFDLATTVNADLRGFYGGFAAGAFLYYVPNYNGGYHGRAVRIDMSDFSPSGVRWFDLVTTVNAGLKGFRGGFFAGEFAYYVPHSDDSGRHGRVVRVKL